MITAMKTKFSRYGTWCIGCCCSMLHLPNHTVVRSSRFSKLVSSLTGDHPKGAIRPVYQIPELDVLHIDGGLDEAWIPASNEVGAPSVLHVLVNFVVSFTLSQPLDVKAIKAKFQGVMDVDYVVERERTAFLNLQWVLWDNGVLEAEKKYEFEIVAEIPSTAPSSLETAVGDIEYTLDVQFDGLLGGSQLQGMTKSVIVWNPHMVFDVPRPGLALGNNMELEMVGATVGFSKNFTAFIRYPDQCFTDQDFPLEISFPGASESALNSITKITVCIFQNHTFVSFSDDDRKHITDSTPITEHLSLSPTLAPLHISIPFSSMTLGRFTTARFRISHTLRITFHRPWIKWKCKWEESVEIFQSSHESCNSSQITN